LGLSFFRGIDISFGLGNKSRLRGTAHDNGWKFDRDRFGDCFWQLVSISLREHYASLCSLSTIFADVESAAI
jgi:hypothetical protein